MKIVMTKDLITSLTKKHSLKLRNKMEDKKEVELEVAFI